MKHAEKPFSLKELKTKEKYPRTFYLPYQFAYDLPLNDYTEQPCLLNEYGYLWLNRDGSPTTLTKPYYDAVLGPDCDPDVRREHYAYMLAAITEYWRSARTCFGINYPFGLAHSLSHGATSDNLMNVSEVEFDPYFEKYMTSAFSPVGVCIEGWDDEFPVNSRVDVPVMITNDLDSPVSGKLSVSIVQKDSSFYTKEFSVSVNSWEQKRTFFSMSFPNKTGNFQLKVTLTYRNKEINSIRKIQMVEE